MTPETVRAASRLAKGRDLTTALEERKRELLGLIVSCHPTKDAEIIQLTLTQYHALTEFGDWVQVGAEELNG